MSSKHSLALISLLSLFTLCAIALELRLTNNPADDYDPAFSPNGNKVVFVSTRTGHCHLFTVPATGGSATQITSGSYDDLNPNWHPNGNKIVFSSDRNGYSHLFTVPTDGGSVTPITSGNFYDFGPDYSPDGTKICFVSNRFSAGYDVCTIPSSGGTITRRTTQNHPMMQADWSHDGNWIAFFSQDPGSPGIWKVPANGGTEISICYGFGEPTWAPNGSMIAFVKGGGTPYGFHIYTIPPSGGTATQRTCHPDDQFPNWSPNSQKIVYGQHYGSPAQFEIFVMNLSETPVEPISIGNLKAIYR